MYGTAFCNFFCKSKLQGRDTTYQFGSRDGSCRTAIGMTGVVRAPVNGTDPTPHDMSQTPETPSRREQEDARRRANPTM